MLNCRLIVSTFIPHDINKGTRILAVIVKLIIKLKVHINVQTNVTFLDIDMRSDKMEYRLYVNI